jgi:hypothetical protein
MHIISTKDFDQGIGLMFEDEFTKFSFIQFKIFHKILMKDY